MSKEFIFASWTDIKDACNEVVKQRPKELDNIKYVYGIPKGGLPIAVYLCNKLGVELLLDEEQVKNLISNDKTRNQILIVDDICDSGETLRKLIGEYIDSVSYTVFYRQKRAQFGPTFTSYVLDTDAWIVFPWEDDEQIKIDKFYEE